MDLFRRKTLMDPSEIEALAGLRPLFDPVFGHLLQEAVAGRVDVYHVAVPLRIILPFDPDYKPSASPQGAAAIAQLVANWNAGQVLRPWVYQRGDVFVLSDDYIILEAAKLGKPDYLPCWVLGKPAHPDIRDLQGPLIVEEIPKLLGWTVNTGKVPPVFAQLQANELGRVVASSGPEDRAVNTQAGALRSLVKTMRLDLIWFVPLILGVFWYLVGPNIQSGFHNVGIVLRLFTWGIFFSPSAYLFLACILASVAVPIQILAIIPGFFSPNAHWYDRRYYLAVGLSIGIVMACVLLQVIIWGSFPFGVDSAGFVHLRLVPFLPWPNTPLFH